MVDVAIRSVEARRSDNGAAPIAHFNALVLNTETRGGLCALRALGRAGYRVAAGAWTDGPGLRSRYASAAVVLPKPNDDVELTVQGLLDWLSSSRADAILAATDASLALLNEHRQLLARLAPPAIPAPEAIRIATSKVATLAIAREFGIPTPRTLVASTTNELRDALLQAGVPAVVKPDTSWVRSGRGGRHVTLAFAPAVEEGVARGAALLEGGRPVLVQPLLSGARENHLILRVKGRVVAHCVLVAERTWPPVGGLTVMRSTIAPPPDSTRYARLLLDGIDLEGFAEVEFRRDDRGSPQLMEVNARLTQALAGALAAGVDFPEMIVRWMRGQEIEGPSRYPVGVRVGWLAGDFRLLAAALSLLPSASPPPPVRTLAGDLVRDYLFRGARIEELDRRDLRPLVTAAVGGGRGALRRALRRGRGRPAP